MSLPNIFAIRHSVCHHSLIGATCYHVGDRKKGMTKRSASDVLPQAAAQAVGGVDDVAKSVVVADVLEPALVDLRNAQAYLALSAYTIRAELRAGRLTAKRYGSKPLFSVAELRRYAESLPSWETK
jgi:hypothetical protein